MRQVHKATNLKELSRRIMMMNFNQLAYSKQLKNLQMTNTLRSLSQSEKRSKREEMREKAFSTSLR